MALAPGSRIGSHVVMSLIGEGGMGEVYRARDVSLGREVAIKRLPEAVANDRERLARFEREARTLAALNHPNVAQIYSVEAGSIVMELVPGDTLRGPLPVDTALNYARQIASALEVAHGRGIVHRDLKPGNIIVTPDGVVKVLDFGLAARDASDVEQDPSRSPTMTATSHGVILGTAAYMAPEQASGKPVDKRADIFAFGVVLWEMLTGRRLFDGETVSHVLAAVLTKEPDLSAVPPRVRLLLARCLAKDPKHRLRDIGDAMSLVGDELVPTAAPARRQVALSGWIVAGTIAVVALVAWPRSRPTGETAVPIARFSIARALDLYNQNSTAFALSPDGSQLAYHDETDDGQYSLFVRSIATGESREVTGAIRSFGPISHSIVWAPDSQRLLRATHVVGSQVIDLTSGSARPFCDCRFNGGDWSRDDMILLGGSAGRTRGILRVSLSDPTPSELTSPNPWEYDYVPVLLPDGRRFFFTRRTNEGDVAYIGSLDGGEPRRLGEGSPRFILPAAGGQPAYLVSVNDVGATAQAIDLATSNTTGPIIMVMPGAVAVSGGAHGILAVSGRGSRQRTVPTWFDRTGRPLGPAAAGAYIESIALSDDGRYLATSEARDGQSPLMNDVWIHDTVTSVRTRLTFNPVNDSTAAWSPDGRRVFYTSRPNGEIRMFSKQVDGTGHEVPVASDDPVEAYANDVSADGRWLIYAAREGANITDLFVRPLEAGGAGRAALYVGGPRRQQQATFSPDGRFVAYGDDQSGVFDIFVQPFPDASGGKWMVSSGGGTEPRWSRDGRELFYLAGQTVMSVPVTLAPTFSMGTAVRLFVAPVQAGYTNESDIWQVAPDGKRFLMLVPEPGQQGPPLQVIVNWQSLLKPATGAERR